MHYVTFNDWFGKINAFRMDVQAGDKILPWLFKVCIFFLYSLAFYFIVTNAKILNCFK